MAANENVPVVDIPEGERTVEQWASLSKESLLLLCDPIVSKPTGPKKKLAEILYNHYHPEKGEKVIEEEQPPPPPPATDVILGRNDMYDDEYERLMNGDDALLDYGSDADAHGGTVQGDGKINTQGGDDVFTHQIHAQGGNMMRDVNDGNIEFTRENRR